MYNNYLRYLRHIVLPNFGIKNQDKIIKSKILCVGAGGLGSPAITYLSLLGVGNIGIIDNDNVETTNLNRQFIFKEKDLQKNKSKIAKKYVQNLNKNINVKIFNDKLNINNSIKIIKNYDIVLDCTDNLETKFLINDKCIELKIPVIHGSIFGYEGYVTVFKKGYNCYRCIYNKLKINECIDYGVFGPIAGIIGIIQASEAINIITNEYSNLLSKILFFNIKNLEYKFIKTKKQKSCKIC